MLRPTERFTDTDLIGDEGDRSVEAKCHHKPEENLQERCGVCLRREIEWILAAVYYLHVGRTLRNYNSSLDRQSHPLSSSFMEPSLIWNRILPEFEIDSLNPRSIVTSRCGGLRSSDDMHWNVWDDYHFRSNNGHEPDNECIELLIKYCPRLAKPPFRTDGSRQITSLFRRSLLYSIFPYSKFRK